MAYVMAIDCSIYYCVEWFIMRRIALATSDGYLQRKKAYFVEWLLLDNGAIRDGEFYMRGM